MGKIVAILGSSGDGKTTSQVINPDGSFNMEDYHGMDPKTHFILNLDGKVLPFSTKMWNTENKNYIETNSFEVIKKTLSWVAKQENIKSISLDTINIYLAEKEFNDRRKMTFDQWRDLANDIIEINMLCNNILRNDQIAYIMGHTMLQTQVDNSEKIVFSVIGKKLTKIQPESFYPIVLMTRIEYGENGDNRYLFQTKACHSSAKTPIGMFDKYEIPNSLSLVDKTIRNYYNI